MPGKRVKYSKRPFYQLIFCSPVCKNLTWMGSYLSNGQSKHLTEIDAKRNSLLPRMRSVYFSQCRLASWKGSELWQDSVRIDRKYGDTYLKLGSYHLFDDRPCAIFCLGRNAVGLANWMEIFEDHFWAEEVHSLGRFLYGCVGFYLEWNSWSKKACCSCCCWGEF